MKDSSEPAVSGQSIFNRNSRTTNVIRISAVGTLCHFVTSAMGFVYRTAFIAVLSTAYLGINGLFWSLLSILSLAELGVGGVIAYRFYAPIARNDLPQLRSLMHFYGRVYYGIAGVVLASGLLLMPLLPFLIKDTQSIPGDVNLYCVYLLYLGQAVCSYLFSYRLSIWAADQKGYVASFISSSIELTKIAAQLAVLYAARDFTLTLAASIICTVVGNILFSVWTTRCYAPVFTGAQPLKKSEKRAVFHDALALMCHRVGTTAVNSTDNVILARCVGLAATGLYSNYYLVMSTLRRILWQLMGEFSASFGNARATLSKSAQYLAFRRMQFVTLSIAGLASTCLWLLIDDFIRLWVGPELLLPPLTALVLVLQFYLEVSLTNIHTNISAMGLFVHDRPRPLIEACLNLAVSVVLALKLGVAGVFIGTVVSSLATAYWRAPLILFRHGFECSVKVYWRQYAVLTFFNLGYALSAAGAVELCGAAADHWWKWFLKAGGIAAGYILANALCFGRTEEARFLAQKLCERMVRRRPA